MGSIAESGERGSSVVGEKEVGRWSQRNHATLRGLLGELTESETEAGTSARDGKNR